MPLPKAVVRITMTATAISLVAWVYGYVTVNHGYYWRDFWFHVLFFIVPVLLLAFSVWVAFHPGIWRKILGGAMLLPSAIVWVLYLLLASSAFRIH